jgi:uncharacterized protein (DUF433 family)
MVTGIGTGIYTSREVSHLTGLSPSRVARWVSGYAFRTGSTIRQSGPLIGRDSDHGPSLTFLDLIEVLFVKAFLEQGVSMRTIRAAAGKAIELFETHHPFAVKIDYDVAGEAARWWPLGKKEPVVIDPKRAFGEPVTTSGNVPTRSIFGAISAGETEQSVAKWYGISIDEVRAAEKFEQRLAA